MAPEAKLHGAAIFPLLRVSNINGHACTLSVLPRAD